VALEDKLALRVSLVRYGVGSAPLKWVVDISGYSARRILILFGTLDAK
jgi:hypothetical protein